MNWKKGKKLHALEKFDQVKGYPRKKLLVRELFSGLSAVESIQRKGNAHRKASAYIPMFAPT